MKLMIISLFCIASFMVADSVMAATMTCQVKVVDGNVVVLENCERATAFQPGDYVKVKLDKKKEKK